MSICRLAFLLSLLTSARAGLTTEWSSASNKGWPLSNEWAYDTTLTLGKWKAKAKVEYNYGVRQR